MEKTKLMLEYEKKTELLALCSEYDEWTEKEYWFTTTKYSEWLEARLAESQTKATAYDRLVSKTIMSDAELDAPLAQKILREMCEKAEAYDRLMSGGKKTLKEWTNIFGSPFAIDCDRRGYAFDNKPQYFPTWKNWHGFAISSINPKFIEFEGDWKDSLTLPDGWEER